MIREELCEAIEDYKDSCHMQCLDFNHSEANRFIRENNHMNLSSEEIDYIYEQEDE